MSPSRRAPAGTSVGACGSASRPWSSAAGWATRNWAAPAPTSSRSGGAETLDFEALRAGLAGAIPFNGHLGLALVEVGPGRGVVKLPDRPELHNHVGTQHAGGLFAAGGFAPGGALIGAVAGPPGEVTPPVPPPPGGGPPPPAR